MILKLGMLHLGLKLYKVYTNDEPRLTLTFFTARSNLVTKAFLWEKVKTVAFSETIAACDLKVGRCRQLIDFMRYVSIKGQGHFLTLAKGCVHSKIQTRFSQKLLCRSEPNFV